MYNIHCINCDTLGTLESFKFRGDDDDDKAEQSRTVSLSTLTMHIESNARINIHVLLLYACCVCSIRFNRISPLSLSHSLRLPLNSKYDSLYRLQSLPLCAVHLNRKIKIDEK